jgi:hypothetical protein
MNDLDQSYKLDQLDQKKLKMALNYYLYTNQGVKSLGEPFDNLYKDTYIKNKIENIKKISCLYDYQNPYQLIHSILNKEDTDPNIIIDFLSRNKSQSIIDNNNKIDLIDKTINTEITTIDDKINDNNKNISSMENAITMLNTKIQKYQNENKKLMEKKKDITNAKIEKIYELQLKNINYSDKNNTLFNVLDNYNHIGYKLNQLSNHLEKLKLFRKNKDKNKDKDKYSLIPDTFCKSKYYIKDNKCICLDKKNKELLCDPYHCNANTNDKGNNICNI